MIRLNGQGLLVISDLNGTLLDASDGDARAAEPALRRLAELEVPLILNSSKPAGEILEVRRRLGITAPFIVENGAALYLPAASGGDEFSVHRFGMPRENILHVLAELDARENFSYLAFSTMSARQLPDSLGLGESLLALLRDRQYTETLLWRDSETALQRFSELLAPRGLQVQRRGELVFLSVPVTKASPVDALLDWYRPRPGFADPTLLALGDGRNDIPLLERADVAVAIMSPDRSYPEVRHEKLIRPEIAGPAGWNQAILDLLRDRQSGATAEDRH